MDEPIQCQKYPFKRFPAEYSAWRNMKMRCSSPKHRQWKLCGGVGIRVSPELASFAGFLKHVGVRPSPGHWLARKDSSKDFSADNVIWQVYAVRNYLTLQRPVNGLSCEDYQRLQGVAKAARIPVSMLQKMLRLGLTTRELLFPPSTPPPAPSLPPSIAASNPAP